MLAISAVEEYEAYDGNYWYPIGVLVESLLGIVTVSYEIPRAIGKTEFAMPEVAGFSHVFVSCEIVQLVVVVPSVVVVGARLSKECVGLSCGLQREEILPNVKDSCEIVHRDLWI